MGGGIDTAVGSSERINVNEIQTNELAKPDSLGGHHVVDICDQDPKEQAHAIFRQGHPLLAPANAASLTGKPTPSSPPKSAISKVPFGPGINELCTLSPPLGLGSSDWFFDDPRRRGNGTTHRTGCRRRRPAYPRTRPCPIFEDPCVFPVSLSRPLLAYVRRRVTPAFVQQSQYIDIGIDACDVSVNGGGCYRCRKQRSCNGSY